MLLLVQALHLAIDLFIIFLPSGTHRTLKRFDLSLTLPKLQDPGQLLSTVRDFLPMHADLLLHQLVVRFLFNLAHQSWSPGLRQILNFRRVDFFSSGHLSSP